MLHAELPGTNRMHSGGWPGKIISSCGGVWFPKADLAQVLLGRRPALRPPSTPDDLRGKCGRSVARSGHSGRDSESQSQALADLLTARAVVWGLGLGPFHGQDEFRPCLSWFVPFVPDVVAFRRPARCRQNEPVFIVVIGRHPIQFNDVAGLVCLCHLLTSDSRTDCLRKLYTFAYPLESAGTHHHIPAAPHFSSRTPAFSGLYSLG